VLVPLRQAEACDALRRVVPLKGKEARFMHVRMSWPARVVVLVAGLFLALSLTRGQERTPSAALAAPQEKSQPNPGTSAETSGVKSARDISKLSDLQKQLWLSATRGAEWLYRANGPDGRFAYGIVPALKAPMEGDHFLRQAGAAAALARAARFTADQRYAARATQAVVALLADTTPDPRDPQSRHTIFSSSAVNRVAAAGLLLLAIHELPAPAEDLLAKSEQLCNYLRKQQLSDGSLNCAETSEASWSDAQDPEGINVYPGLALYGLMCSQQRRPAAWKTDVVRNALAYYKAWWRKHKSMTFVPWQTAAYTEAFLLTKEQAFADFVFEMNDWICLLQYQGFDDPKQVYWSGGFKSWADGKAVELAPSVESAYYAEGLAQACRVARQTADLNRHKTYLAALERSLLFLTTLQYTEANTQHFADWYRLILQGGFHASHQDGNLRIDYTQHATSALVIYLTHEARMP
jgi:hypothetical protein